MTLVYVQIYSLVWIEIIQSGVWIDDTPLQSACMHDQFETVKYLMEGPLRNVAALENVCTRARIDVDTVDFVCSLLVLNKKDEMLGCVLDVCDILPSRMEECFGWWDDCVN